ncbi:hypothetical protein Ndes2526A_g04243 [Nannochloris sp. 'desiccata']
MAGMAIRQRVEGGQGLERRAICMRLGGHHRLPWRVVSVILGPCGFFRRFKGPLIGVLLHDLQFPQKCFKGKALIPRLRLTSDKLPSPSGPIALTLLVPTNKAFLSMLWKNGLFIPILDKVKDALPATVLYNVMVGSITPEKVQTYSSSNQGVAPSAYGLLGGSANANLGYYGAQDEGGQWFSCFQPGMNEGLACSGTAIKVCNSYIYITDEVLVPSDNEKLGGVQPVTIPEALFGGGGGPEPATAATGDTTLVPDVPIVVEVAEEPPVEEPPAPSCVIPSNVKPVVADPAPAPAADPSGAVQPVPLVDPAPVDPATTTPPASGPICNTTLAEAAKANGLSILATALSQPAIASQMPDPANPTTYFAPVDAAFLNLLTTLNITITDALALGDKLAGVILYHIHPNEALSIDALAQRDTVNTELGFRMNDASQYIVGVDATTTALTLKGLRTGNVATVQKEFPLCGSNVIVIDQALLPAETLELLPSPGPNVAPQTGVVANAVMAEESALPGTTSDGLGDLLGVAEDTLGNLGDGLGDSLGDLGALVGGEGGLGESLGGLTDIIDEILPGILDGGLASGVGQFMNCTINLNAAGTELTTTTDGNGRFAFPGVPECALADGTVTLPAGLDQLASCIDNSTGLQPPYTLTTLLSTFLGAANSSSGLATGDFPLNLSPLTSLLSSLGLGGNGGNGSFNFADIAGNLSGALGFNDQSNAAFGDILQGLTDGNPDSLANILTNAQSMISSLVGSDVLSQLLPGVNIDQAVAALNQVVGTDPVKFLTNLTDPATIQQLLQSGFDLLQGGFLGGSGSSTGGLTDLISGITGGRKMLQDAATATFSTTATASPTQEELSAIFAAVAQPTALLNKLAKDAAANGDGSLTPQEVANLASRCARVAQLRLAPAAADLANGKLSISDFQNSYSDEQVTKAVSMEDTASTTIPQVISPTASSAAIPVSPGSVATILAGLFSVTLYAGLL